MSIEVIDPASAAGIASTALEQALATLRQVGVQAKAVAAIAQAAQASQDAVTALLKAVGVAHRWSGTSLQLMLPDGSYGPAIDLRGVQGIPGPTPTLRVGQVSTGAPAVLVHSDDPLNPVLDFVFAKGDKGDRGDVGPKGDTGGQGPQGLPGTTAAKGDKGDTGPTGAPGATGPAGAQGPQGPQGQKGDVGSQGVAGATGPKGDTGAQGAPGAQGAKGDTGATGPAGLNASAFPVSGVVAKTAVYTILPADKGTMFDLTGSFTLTLPAASAASAATPLYYHFRKRDGSGRCVIACAGPDTFPAGATAISVYQEDVTLVCFGGAWYAPPGGRQRGWISIGSTTIASAVASVGFTTGFTDPELREIELDFNAVSLSANGFIVGQVIKAGAIQTTGYAYSGIFSSGGGTATGIGTNGSASYFPLNGTGGYAPPYNGTVNLANPQSLAGSQRTKFQSSSGLSSGAGFNMGEGFHNTAGPITGFVLSPGSGTITGGTFNQKGFRP